MSKLKLQKILGNLEKEPEQIHKFYDRVIRLSSNLSNKPFPRKEPKQNWSVYKTEEEYEQSLTSAINFSKGFKDIEKKSIDVVIYNGNNADGVFSGYIAWLYLVKENKKDVLFIPSTPDFTRNNVSYKIKNIESKISGKNVLLLDLKYNRETIEYIKSITKFFVDLDNHKSPDLTNLDYVFISKDNKAENMKGKKGHGTVAICWKFFYPTEKVPYIFQSIDSADVKLYLKYLPDPDPIMMALDVTFVKNQSKKYYGNESKLFEDIDIFLNESDSIKALNFISILGQIMGRYAENMKNETASKAVKKTLKLPNGNRYEVWVLNYTQTGLSKRIAKNVAERNNGLSLLWYYDYNRNLIDISISTNHRPGVQNPLFDIKNGFGSGGVEGDTYHVQLKNKPVGDISKYII